MCILESSCYCHVRIVEGEDLKTFVVTFIKLA